MESKAGLMCLAYGLCAGAESLILAMKASLHICATCFSLMQIIFLNSGAGSSGCPADFGKVGFHVPFLELLVSGLTIRRATSGKDLLQYANVQVSRSLCFLLKPANSKAVGVGTAHTPTC